MLDGTVDTNRGKGGRSRGLKVESSEIEEDRYVFSGSATRTCQREYTPAAREYRYIYTRVASTRTHLSTRESAYTHTSSRTFILAVSPCAQKRSGRRSLSEYFPSNLISPGGAQYARYLARPEDERGDSDGKRGRGCIADITMRGGFSRGRLEVCFARGRNRNVGKFFLDSPLLSRHAPPFTGIV